MWSKVILNFSSYIKRNEEKPIDQDITLIIRTKAHKNYKANAFLNF